jgi:hypothetical protein
MNEREDAQFRAITAGLNLSPPDYRPPGTPVRRSARIGYHLGNLAVLVGLFVASSYLHLHGFWSGVRYTLAVSWVLDVLLSAFADIYTTYFTAGIFCPHCRHRVNRWEAR